MQKQNFIDRLDAFFSQKKSSEVTLILAGTFVLIAAVVYLYVFPASEQYLQTKTSEYQAEKNRVDAERHYIDTNTEVVPRLENYIRTKTNQLADTRYINAHVDNKLKELSYLLFSDERWAEFMDRITFLGKKNNHKIIRIANDFVDDENKTEGKVEQVLNINVDFNGGFHNTMKFINAIEESQLVVDVNELNLVGSKGIDSNITISVWGMIY